MKREKYHGGSWKVAYADFVTAMMALFLVLWLTAQDTRIKEAIERAFKNPFSSATKESVGILPNKDVQALQQATGNFPRTAPTPLGASCSNRGSRPIKSTRFRGSAIRSR